MTKKDDTQSYRESVYDHSLQCDGQCSNVDCQEMKKVAKNDELSLCARKNLKIFTCTPAKVAERVWNLIHHTTRREMNDDGAATPTARHEFEQLNSSYYACRPFFNNDADTRSDHSNMVLLATLCLNYGDLDSAIKTGEIENLFDAITCTAQQEAMMQFIDDRKKLSFSPEHALLLEDITFSLFVRTYFQE